VKYNNDSFDNFTAWSLIIGVIIATTLLSVGCYLGFFSMLVIGPEDLIYIGIGMMCFGILLLGLSR